MPVIIDEVVISVEVTNKDSGASGGAPSSQDKQSIVNECIERVLDILKQKAER